MEKIEILTSKIITLASFEKDKHYVTLSLNLSDVGSPFKYKVIFYAEAQSDGV
jgi:hypothetical protein